MKLKDILKDSESLSALIGYLSSHGGSLFIKALVEERDSLLIRAMIEQDRDKQLNLIGEARGLNTAIRMKDKALKAVNENKEDE